MGQHEISDGFVLPPGPQSSRTDGVIYTLLPYGEALGVSPRVTSIAYYTVAPTDTNLSLYIYCMADNPPTHNRTTIGVGEQVQLSFRPNVPTNTTWTALKGSVSPTSGAATLFTAPSNAVRAMILVTLPGNKTKVLDFNVVEPMGFTPPLVTNSNPLALSAPEAGASMAVTMSLLPTHVSFANVQLSEVSNNAVNISNYFANTNIFTTNPAYFLRHQTAGFWIEDSLDNSYGDAVGIPPTNLPSPWSSGSFQYVIPIQWKVGDNGATNNLMTNTATFSIDGNGTVTVERWGHSVTRTTNGDITTH